MSIAKKNGLFAYAITTLAGAGGAITKNLFSDADGYGQLLTSFPVQTSGTFHVMGRYTYCPIAFASSGNFAKLTIVGTPTYDSNSSPTLCTGLSFTCTNASAGAGDTLTFLLQIDLLNLANMDI
jgi:hypothetical protein